MRWRSNYRNEALCVSPSNSQWEGEREKPAFNCCRERHRGSSCNCLADHPPCPAHIRFHLLPRLPCVPGPGTGGGGGTPLSAGLAMKLDEGSQTVTFTVVPVLLPVRKHNHFFIYVPYEYMFFIRATFL